MLTATKRQVVQWGEVDAAGIVFYPNYFRWFDQATHDLLGNAGAPVRTMLEAGFAIPIVETRARFLEPISYGDEVEIVSRVAETRTRAFRIEHSATKEGSLVLEGFEVRMWVRAKPVEGRLVAERIPDDFRRLLLNE